MAMMEDEMAELWFEQQYAQEMEAMQEVDAPVPLRKPSARLFDDVDEAPAPVPSLADTVPQPQQQSEHMREIMSRINEFSMTSPFKAASSSGSLMHAFKRPASKHVGFLEEPFAAAGFGAKLTAVSANG